MSPARNIAHSKPSEIDWKYGRADGRIAGQEHRRGGERVVARPRCGPLTAGRIASPVEVEGYPDDLEVADELAIRLLLDLVDEAVHRLGDAREVAAKPLAVELLRHRLVLLGGDADDARHVADASVVAHAVDHRNELVARVLDVLVVLAVLVAGICLAVQERDDERVLEHEVERVRALRPRRRSPVPGDLEAATCCPCSRSGRLPARASRSRPPPSRRRRSAPPDSSRANRSGR